MNKLVRPYKVVCIFIVLAMVLSIYAVALYDLQIVNSKGYGKETANTTTSRRYVAAARGDILDRNGILLVSSKPQYNIVIDRSELLDAEDPNGVIFGLIELAKEYDLEHNDSFPITFAAPFNYVSDISETQQSRLDTYLDYFGLDADISASDLFVWLKKHYSLDYTTNISDARLIMGIRYELECRVIMNISEYVFAEDADVGMLAEIMEKEYPGVSYETDETREYHTKYAAHLLGTTGAMSPEEYEVYKEQGYAMNAIVGKTGVEKAFEEYLHGTDGVTAITTNDDGAVINENVIEEASAGNNVYLSIDIKMQEVAEKALGDTIAQLNLDREEDEEKATGGAAVVLDVKSGETLTLASYPSYDISTFNENYTALDKDPLKPMLNRATMEIYNPGSTFKMVTAYAGLTTGNISTNTWVEDKGIYTQYSDYQPKCWVYPGDHGTINIVGALENSCNYFFYWLGDILGADAINNAAEVFGLGSKTGIEISEEEGLLFTPDYKKENLPENDQQWWAADSLMLAIGQKDKYTPIQIANCVASIANDGTVYKTTLLDSVKSHDYSETVYEKEPEINKIISDRDGYLGVLRQGMTAVASTGTASSVFGGYKVSVGAKTGTVQSDSATINNGVFVCYAPADDPEIAVAVVVEKGGSGSGIMAVAKNILDYYFGADEYSFTVSSDNELVR